MVTQDNLDQGRVYPPLEHIFHVSTEIAIAITEYAYASKVATYYPEPANKREFVKAQLYSTSYEDFTPHIYDWPTA